MKNLKMYLIIAVVFLTSVFPLLANSFTDNSDGTVTDSTTNLRWQKCSGTEAQGSISADNSYNATCSGIEITYTWANALNYCKNLFLAGKAWRLPSANELNSIVDIGKTAAPFIDTTLFPGTITSFYWSASTDTDAMFPWAALSVNFSDGGVYGPNKPNAYYVRCVTN
jgi:hypothetical protein